MDKKTIANRLEAALQARNGGNQSEMARFIGVSPQAVQKWISGEAEPKGSNLHMAAEFLGVSPVQLKFGEDIERHQPNVMAFEPGDALGDGFVEIPEYEITFSAGHGSHAAYDFAESGEPAVYRRSFFQRNRINPARTKRFRIRGDSMEPRMYDGDTVLVNLDETNIVDGKIYAIRYGDDLRVKRLSRRLDGTLIINSINTHYRDEEVRAEVAEEHISIIGRVRDISGAGGL